MEKSFEILKPDKLLSMKNIKGIVIVGSSGSGKTTLVNSLREDEKFTIPQRIVTRPLRQNDDLIENDFASLDEILKIYNEGKISFYWTRNMEGDRTENYAFKEIEKNKFPIFSGNNAIFDNKESIKPEGYLNDYIIVGIHTPDYTRKERLENRSPDLFKNSVSEMKYRLGDVSDNLKSEVDILFYNDQKLEDSISSFKKFINEFI